MSPKKHFKVKDW